MPHTARWIAAVLILVSASAVSAAQYIHEDASVRGREIYAFQHDDRNVLVVLGDFRLKVGERVVSGRDAVLWIDTEQVGNVTRHSIRAYAEGQARVAEPGQTAMRDRVILVTINQQGRLTAGPRIIQRDLSNLPIFQRALRTLKGEAEGETRPAGEAPTIVRRPRDDDDDGFELRDMTPEDQPETAPAQEEPAEEAEPPAPPQPVYVTADRFTSEVADGRRVTVIRGNVYLSQRVGDSDEFLELRADEAVIFSGIADLSAKETRSPLSPQFEGLPSNLGTEGQREVVTGVYLEGDIRIARGERVLSGRSAFYDFTTDRATIVEPVFRTIQEQRNIPIYVRASKARMLSAREIVFDDAKVTSSDFHTPSYHMGASRAVIVDDAPYDEQGVRLSQPRWQATLTNATLNARGVPLLYWPYIKTDFEHGHTPLRKLQVGQHGDFGWGVESGWHLFRLLGLIPPEGVRGRFSLDWYERGVVSGVDLRYARRNYSGYDLLYGVIDNEGEDDFGDDRENIPAPQERGRLLMRHKQYLEPGTEMQFELSYLCDRNFLEEYFPNEFYAGKEQETLLYAKKQQDNWAVTGLLKYRLNRFQTQTESWPDVAFYVQGQSLLDDRLTLFNETHAGIKRYRYDNDLKIDDSDAFPRLDQRNEINLPMHIGWLNTVAYATGRASWWEETPDGDDQCRPYGQVGLRANTHISRVYNGVESRLWNLNRLRHIITPEATAFVASAHGVQPDDLFPMDPGIEEHIDRTSGVSFGVYQRLQTKRGLPEAPRNVDWMRLNLVATFYDNGNDPLPSDGRFFWYRPEYSLGRNAINGYYAWHISDATEFLADANYDIDGNRLGTASAAMAIRRDPRLRYYVGMRYIDDLDSSVATAGFDYQLTRKYSLGVFEQYDFSYDDGTNLTTSISLIRKFPRWFIGLTFVYSATDDDVAVLLALWPEGIPELRLGTSRMTPLGRSDRN